MGMKSELAKRCLKIRQWVQGQNTRTSLLKGVRKFV